MDDATPQDTNRARTPRSREGKIAIAAIGGFVMLCVAMFAWMSLIAPNTLYEGLQKQFQAGNYDHVVARIDAQADGPEGVQGLPDRMRELFDQAVAFGDAKRAWQEGNFNLAFDRVQRAAISELPVDSEAHRLKARIEALKALQSKESKLSGMSQEEFKAMLVGYQPELPNVNEQERLLLDSLLKQYNIEGKAPFTTDLVLELWPRQTFSGSSE